MIFRLMKIKMKIFEIFSPVASEKLAETQSIATIAPRELARAPLLLCCLNWY